MKISRHKQPNSRVTAYTLSLSANETYAWANKPDAAWPCSTIAGSRISVFADQNGIAEFMIDGKPDWGTVDGTELDAIVADHLPPDCRHLWPVWESETNCCAIAADGSR